MVGSSPFESIYGGVKQVRSWLLGLSRWLDGNGFGKSVGWLRIWWMMCDYSLMRTRNGCLSSDFELSGARRQRFRSRRGLG